MGKNLWGSYKIPVVVLAGEAGSGKTMWGLTVDPDVLNFDVPPSVLAVDTEGSSEPYEDILNFKRIDLVRQCVEAYGGNYNPMQMYIAFRDIVKNLNPGKYSAAMVDTASEIEAGHADYVRSHPGEFGYTQAQFTRMNAVMWGAVKADYKKLMMALASKVETLVICVHMSDEFKSGKPTHKRKPKGKSTLLEIASLYMILDRTAPVGKKDPPMVPSGITNPPTGKTRIIGVVDGKIQQMLPPYLKDASPNGVRDYLINPVDFSNLAISDRARPTQEMTDDDRLEIRSSIAADEAARANADLATEELRREIKSEVVDVPAPRIIKDLTKIKEDTREEYYDSQYRDDIKKALLGAMTVDKAVVLLNTQYGVSKIADLNNAQVADLDKYIKELAKNSTSGPVSPGH